MIKNALNIFFCFFMLASSSGAVELEEYRGPDITVRYEVPLKDAARRIASDYGKNRTDIEMKLGWRLRIAPAVVLVRDHDAFQEIAGNKLVTAFAIPERNLIVIDYSRMGRTPFDLEDTFKHELSHILLHQELDASSLPKWLDEGIAQWASGGIADIIRTGEKELLQQAVLSHRMIALKDIAAAFPDSPNSLILAYEEGKSFTEFIVQHYGEARLRSLLQSLEKQEALEEAVNENLGVSLDSLEQTWKKSLSGGNPWISYIADHMSWALFFFAALISVAGYCVVKRRMRNYRDEDEDRGEGDSVGPADDH